LYNASPLSSRRFNLADLEILDTLRLVDVILVVVRAVTCSPRPSDLMKPGIVEDLLLDLKVCFMALFVLLLELPFMMGFVSVVFLARSSFALNTAETVCLAAGALVIEL
jgi:hypothetical protein